jgi:hypothetical protein
MFKFAIQEKKSNIGLRTSFEAGDFAERSAAHALYEVSTNSSFGFLSRG